MNTAHIIYIPLLLIGGYCIRLLHERYTVSRKSGKSMRAAVFASITGKDL